MNLGLGMNTFLVCLTITGSLALENDHNHLLLKFQHRRSGGAKSSWST